MEENIPAELNLDVEWSIGEQSFAHIRDLLAAINSHCIVEFGSGRSSVRLALLFPESKIISFENSEQSFFETQKLKEKFAKQTKLELRYEPLMHRWIKGGHYLTYRSVIIKKTIDAVIIDGPPKTTRRGREACLYAIYEKLRIGSIVVLDDCQRSDERQIIKNWISVFGDSFKLSFIESDHHLAVLRKIREIKPHWLSIERLKDNWWLNFKKAIKAILPKFLIDYLKRIAEQRNI